MYASSGNVAAAASVCGLKTGSWEWVGGNTSSTIAEWGLICDRKFLAAIPASLYFLGSLIGKLDKYITIHFPFQLHPSLSCIYHRKDDIKHFSQFSLYLLKDS